MGNWNGSWETLNPGASSTINYPATVSLLLIVHNPSTSTAGKIFYTVGGGAPVAVSAPAGSAFPIPVIINAGNSNLTVSNAAEGTPIDVALAYPGSPLANVTLVPAAAATVPSLTYGHRSTNAGFEQFTLSQPSGNQTTFFAVWVGQTSLTLYAVNSTDTPPPPYQAANVTSNSSLTLPASNYYGQLVTVFNTSLQATPAAKVLDTTFS